MHDMEYVSFGSDDRILVGAGIGSKCGPQWDRVVILWELEMCAITNCVQAVIKSKFSICSAARISDGNTISFIPFMNAFVYVDSQGRDIIVVDVVTGKEIGRMETPEPPKHIKSVNEGAVVLL